MTMMTLVGRVIGMRDAIADSDVEGDADAVDPLVSAYRHDVHKLRARALGRVAERYCSKSEFKVKSLTPTRSI
jgi:hypothetical protein